MCYLAVVLVNLLFFSTGILAQEVRAGGGGAQDDWPAADQKLIHRVSSAAYPTEAAEAYGKLFKQIGRDGIRRLQAHPSDSIAIQAAWEEVAFTVPEKKKAGQTFHPDRNTLNWFLGFLQGRGRVQPSKWWKDLLLDARANHRYNVYFDLPENLDRGFPGPSEWKSLYHDSGFSLVTSPLDTTLRREGSTMALRVGKESAEFPEDLLSKYRTQIPDGGVKCGVSALITPSRCYLAVHHMISGYQLICLERPSSKVLWRTDGWGSFWGIFTGSRHEQWLTVTEQDSRVVVFGCGVGIHCEAFRSGDGTNLFRFSNGYSKWDR